MDRRKLLSIISLVFSITMGMLVILGSLVMMYGNFDLGVILFVLGLLLVISNEGLLPKIKLIKAKNTLGMNGTIEEIINLAILGYTPPILISFYMYLSGEYDAKLIIFLGICLTVVTMKIFAKLSTSKFIYKPIEEEEIYIYKASQSEMSNEPGI
ncbi:MAG: hypothetical protein ACK4J0_03205 [Candidatus Anstonellaceae archaeon]